jgi:hypothetical protein
MPWSGHRGALLAALCSRNLWRAPERLGRWPSRGSPLPRLLTAPFGTTDVHDERLGRDDTNRIPGGSWPADRTLQQWHPQYECERHRGRSRQLRVLHLSRVLDAALSSAEAGPLSRNERRTRRGTRCGTGFAPPLHKTIPSRGTGWLGGQMSERACSHPSRGSGRITAAGMEK